MRTNTKLRDVVARQARTTGAEEAMMEQLVRPDRDLADRR
jgi:hypothetical protein